MTKKERAAFVAKKLEELYPEVPIPLQHKDPYTLLIAVVLSAQCTDKRVNQITPLLFARADNPRDMAALPVEEIEDIIRPCGLSCFSGGYPYPSPCRPLEAQRREERQKNRGRFEKTLSRRSLE